jgi:hypothetical protein
MILINGTGISAGFSGFQVVRNAAMASINIRTITAPTIC